VTSTNTPFAQLARRRQPLQLTQDQLIPETRARCSARTAGPTVRRGLPRTCGTWPGRSASYRLVRAVAPRADMSYELLALARSQPADPAVRRDPGSSCAAR
jgi:hypothetical protein